MAAPKRELFKAAEVCELVQVQPYVLRSWEAEFPQLGAPSPGGGTRLYRRADIDLVLRIKQLVFSEGLTLSGARRRLEQEDDGSEASSVDVEDLLGRQVRDRLKVVRSGLESILRLLANDHRPAELQLVPPPPRRKKTTEVRRKKK
jgi:DNA-binding transcriptional MerR regulator